MTPTIPHLAALALLACAMGASAAPTPIITETKQVQSPAHAKTTRHTKHKRPTKPKSEATAGLYASRPDAMQAADGIAQRLNLDPQWVRYAIGQSRYIPAIAKAVIPPAVGAPKNWAVYRSHFIDPQRIKAGVKFWLDNREALERAQAQWGVPPAIIVGIVGVETIYGQQTGGYRVMDALTTLAFDFPAQHPRAEQRAAFFLSELEAFLALAQRTGTDPLALRGSYAGAMGMPQFMPSSWAKYAVDFDGDGRIDLFHSAADVIGSVANYFKAFGWQSGMPTHYPVRMRAQGLEKAALLAPDIVPTFSPQAMVDNGCELDEPALQHQGLLALIELQNGDAPPLYLAGTSNFYTITRYNWSSYYAMAVIELGQEVAAAMPK